MATVTQKLTAIEEERARGRGGGGAGRKSNEHLRQLLQTAFAKQNGYGAALYHTRTIKTRVCVNRVTQLYNGSYVHPTAPKLHYNTLNS